MWVNLGALTPSPSVVRTNVVWAFGLGVSFSSLVLSFFLSILSSPDFSCRLTKQGQGSRANNSCIDQDLQLNSGNSQAGVPNLAVH